MTDPQCLHWSGSVSWCQCARAPHRAKHASCSDIRQGRRRRVEKCRLWQWVIDCKSDTVVGLNRNRRKTVSPSRVYRLLWRSQTITLKITRNAPHSFLLQTQRHCDTHVHDVICKTESTQCIAMPSVKDWDTATAGNMYRKSGKIRACFFEICKNTQTDRHDDRNTLHPY